MIGKGLFGAFRLPLRTFAGMSVVVGALLVYGAPASAASVPGRYIVVLKASVKDPRVVANEHARADDFRVRRVFNYALKGYAAAIPRRRLASLRADRRVAYVAAEHLFKLAGESPRACGDPVTCQVLSSAILRIGGNESSTRSGDGRGSVPVNVAVIDSGIGPHPDLNVVGGKNCSGDTGGIADVVGHGTVVAGVIGALDNRFGVVGVAPGARLWSLRVVDSQGNISDESVLCAIDWVTQTRGDRDRTNDIAVANMSLGAPGADDGHCGQLDGDPFHQAICRSTRAGVTWVAAAGNEGADLANGIPASYDEVLTATAMSDTDGRPGGLGPVDACDQLFNDDTVPFFSNFAVTPADRAHTLAAPGVCVESTVPPSLNPGGATPYFAASGTSFSSPAIAGTAALCIAHGDCRGLSPRQIIRKLIDDAAAYNRAHRHYGFSGDPLHSPDPSKYYGYLIRPALY